MHFVRLVSHAYASWGATLGTVLGAIALTNLVVRTLRLSLAELLALLLDAYQKTFHPPIAFLFSWLPFPLPASVKDGILIYMAMAGVLYRALSYQGRLPEIAAQLTTPRGLRLRMFAGRILAAALWPYFIASIVRKPLLLIRDKHNRDRGRLPPMDRKLVQEFLAGDPGEPTVLCDERQLIVCYFVTLLVAMMALLLLNAAVNQLEVSFRQLSLAIEFSSPRAA